ncbi:MAG: hypothetical protein Q8R55_03490 [Candidatus Taylorbacteria bacterium]|nr:hypothetical protein [Candidatus Taylorbacteria bacterium]
MPELKFAKNVFSAEQNIDDTWYNWAKASARSGQELTEIVYGQFQEEYQKRALFLLLIPDTRLALFFGWKNRPPFHFLNHEVNFKKVGAGLRAHAIYWLTEFIDYARFRSMNSGHREILLDAYNKYILHLLEVLPVEDNQAETVFSYLSLNDPTPWADSEDGSGYNPLYQLWKNPKINERWKKSAEVEMRQIIASELRGDTTPREPYENALKCYARHLRFILDEKEHLPYSKELFADQIRFLISLEVSDQNLFKPWKVPPILNILAGEEYLDLRHKFIRFVLLRDGNFGVLNEETEKAAKTILHEFVHDNQILPEISDQLRNYRDQNEKMKQESEEEAKTEEALLSAMRQPDAIPRNNENQSEQ